MSKSGLADALNPHLTPWLHRIFEERLVLPSVDNLNTHSPAAFYEAFSPQQARYLTKKLEFHYTVEHSSWLNMAEVEISVLTEQSLDRGLASQAIVASEVGAWTLLESRKKLKARKMLVNHAESPAIRCTLCQVALPYLVR